MRLNCCLNRSWLRRLSGSAFCVRGCRTVWSNNVLHSGSMITFTSSRVLLSFARGCCWILYFSPVHGNDMFAMSLLQLYGLVADVCVPNIEDNKLLTCVLLCDNSQQCSIPCIKHASVKVDCTVAAMTETKPCIPSYW